MGQVLPGLPEPDQLAFLDQNHQSSLHGALSLALRRRSDPGLAARSAAWLLNGKAAAQQALVERNLLARDSHDPNLKDTARQLTAARAQLAKLTFAPLLPGQETDRRKELGRPTQR